MTVEVVVFPQPPDAGRSSHVPQGDGVIVVAYGLHVKSKSRLCGHKITKRQFIQERSFT